MSPTTVTLASLFAGIHIPPELADLKLYNVRANAADRTMELTLYSEELIPYAAIEAVKEEAQRKFDLQRLVIKVKYENVLLSDVDLPLYYENLVFYVNTLAPGVRSLLTDSTAQLREGVLYVRCRYGTEMLLEKGCGQLLEKLIFSQLGERVQVKFVDVSEEDGLEKLQAETLEKLEKIVPPPPKPEKASAAADNDGIILGKPIKGEPVPLSSITEGDSTVVVRGEVYGADSRELRSGKMLLLFCITDETSSYSAKAFLEKDKFAAVKSQVKNGIYVTLRGRIQYDTFARENIIMVNDISLAQKPLREDNAAEKRVELHLHTQMSAMDGMTSASDLVSTAARWGHKAVAITDHGNVQAFPEAANAAKKHGIKVIYGVEAYLVSDTVPIVYGDAQGD